MSAVAIIKQRQLNDRSTTVQPNSTDKKREEKKKKDKIIEEDIYRRFAHLRLSIEDFDSLKEKYSKQQIDDILDSIENYKGNKNYKSLYITCKNWLKKDAKSTKAVKYDPKKLDETTDYSVGL